MFPPTAHPVQGDGQLGPASGPRAVGGPPLRWGADPRDSVPRGRAPPKLSVASADPVDDQDLAARVVDVGDDLLDQEPHQALLEPHVSGRAADANAQARGIDRRTFVPREGPALLQGLAVCGRCGTPMSVRYHVRRGSVSPDYVCAGMRSTLATPKCQASSGAAIDRGDGRAAGRSGDARGPRGHLGRGAGPPRARRRGRSPALPAGGTGPLRGRTRAAAIPASRSGQPPGRRCPREWLERSAAGPAGKSSMYVQLQVRRYLEGFEHVAPAARLRLG